jgi:putative modified peptide
MSFQLPAQIVDRLLDLLGHDDEFRNIFAANPREALAMLGYAAAADTSIGAGIWICLATERLATKAMICETRAALRRQLVENDTTFNPIGLGIALGFPSSDDCRVAVVGATEDHK